MITKDILIIKDLPLLEINVIICISTKEEDLIMLTQETVNRRKQRADNYEVSSRSYSVPTGTYSYTVIGSTSTYYCFIGGQESRQYCQCKDFEQNSRKHPHFCCKHIYAALHAIGYSSYQEYLSDDKKDAIENFRFSGMTFIIK